MSIASFRVLLVGDPVTQSYVGDQVGPPDAFVDEKPPYITLEIAGGEMFNTLQGPANLSRTEIEVRAWARSYQDADSILLAARAAIQAADPGNIVIRKETDRTIFQGDIPVYGRALIFQTFDTDD